MLVQYIISMIMFFFSFLYVHVHNVIFNMILQTNYTLADLSKKPSESTFVLTYGRVPLTLTEQIRIDY